MNNENLIPQNKRTKSEQREIAAMGGKASGQQRRENARLRKMIKAALETIDAESGLTLKEKAVINVVKAAASGDLKAFAVVMQLIGEYETSPASIYADEWQPI